MAVIRPPWMPDGLYQTWLNYYMDAGGQAGGTAAEATAIEMTRQDPTYVTYFPGIKREDGVIRYADDPEATYYNNIQAFRNTVEGLDMAPDVFNEEYIALIEGDVSPNEFSSRASSLEDRVMSQGPGIRDWYAENYGLEMTNQGILASLMSKRIDDAVLNRQLTMAEIGGSATDRGYGLTSEFVNLLAEEGMDRADAQRTFGSAQSLMPILGAMARRHNDPNDEYTIEEFTSAAFLDDPEQLQRLERFQAQEQSQFTGGYELGYDRNRGGMTTGLDEV